jgi:acetyl-CoA acetyltransferase
VSVVGAGESDLGRVAEGLTSLDLAGQAAARAASDAGIGLDEIDGIFSTTSHYAMSGLELAEYLGIRPSYSDSNNLGGASFVSHLLHAVNAIDAGLCSTALIAYGSTQLSDGGSLVTASLPNLYETAYKPRYPVTMYALAAARHMYEFGTTREQLAEVAVAARSWAQLTPGAFRTDPLTVEDVLASRMISDPLTIADCCLVTDGGGAVILTATERARSLRREPVLLRERGGRTVRRRRAYLAWGITSGEHERRWAVVYTPWYVRHIPPHRSDKTAPRRRGPTSGAGIERRARARQRRGTLRSGDGPAGYNGRTLGSND